MYRGNIPIGYQSNTVHGVERHFWRGQFAEYDPIRYLTTYFKLASILREYKSLIQNR